MKKHHTRLSEGTIPSGFEETNERIKNAKQRPKVYVPYKDRLTMGDPNPKRHINQGHRPKVKVTLPKIKI